MSLWPKTKNEINRNENYVFTESPEGFYGHGGPLV